MNRNEVNKLFRKQSKKGHSDLSYDNTIVEKIQKYALMVGSGPSAMQSLLVAASGIVQGTKLRSGLNFQSSAIRGGRSGFRGGLVSRHGVGGRLGRIGDIRFNLKGRNLGSQGKRIYRGTFTYLSPLSEQNAKRPDNDIDEIDTLGVFSSWILKIKYNYATLVFSALLPIKNRTDSKWYDWPGISHEVWTYLNPALTRNQHFHPLLGGVGTEMWHTPPADLFRVSATRGIGEFWTGALKYGSYLSEHTANYVEKKLRRIKHREYEYRLKQIKKMILPPKPRRPRRIRLPIVGRSGRNISNVKLKARIIRKKNRG